MKSQTNKTLMDSPLNPFAIATLCAVAIALPIASSGQEPQLGVSASAKHATIITFDPPGSTLTPPSQINPAGELAGFSLAAGGMIHGFLRAPDGTFTTFEAPGAGTGSFQGTLGFSINPEGAVTGYYRDASTVLPGFLRHRP